MGGSSNYITINILPSTVETPAPTVSGRLEQFQNDAGELIFPRTIIEGIFRRSNGKSLTEILSENGVGDVDLSLYAPKAYPVFTGSISLGCTPGVEIGEGAVAIGGEVQAPRWFSAAIGAFSKPNEMASCAFGFDVTANAKHQCVVGMKNIISSSESDRFIVGGGSTG